MDNKGNEFMDKTMVEFSKNISNYLEKNGREEYENCMLGLYVKVVKEEKITYEAAKSILKIAYGCNYLNDKKNVLDNYINYILINQNNKTDISNNKCGWADAIKCIISEQYFNTDRVKKLSEHMTEIREELKL